MGCAGGTQRRCGLFAGYERERERDRLSLIGKKRRGQKLREGLVLARDHALDAEALRLGEGDFALEAREGSREFEAGRERLRNEPSLHVEIYPRKYNV